MVPCLSVQILAPPGIYLSRGALIISSRGPKLVRMFYEHPTHLASSSLPLNRVEV